MLYIVDEILYSCNCNLVLLESLRRFSGDFLRYMANRNQRCLLKIQFNSVCKLQNQIAIVVEWHERIYKMKCWMKNQFKFQFGFCGHLVWSFRSWTTIIHPARIEFRRLYNYFFRYATFSFHWYDSGYVGGGVCDNTKLDMKYFIHFRYERFNLFQLETFIIKASNMWANLCARV